MSQHGNCKQYTGDPAGQRNRELKWDIFANNHYAEPTSQLSYPKEASKGNWSFSKILCMGRKEFFKEQEDWTVSQGGKYELQVQDGIDRWSLKDRFYYSGMYWH